MIYREIGQSQRFPEHGGRSNLSTSLGVISRQINRSEQESTGFEVRVTSHFGYTKKKHSVERYFPGV